MRNGMQEAPSREYFEGRRRERINRRRRREAGAALLERWHRENTDPAPTAGQLYNPFDRWFYRVEPRYGRFEDEYREAFIDGGQDGYIPTRREWESMTTEEKYLFLYPDGEIPWTGVNLSYPFEGALGVDDAPR